MPQFVQHIANAWTERISPTQQLVHVLYVGYETMPDFHAWSVPGRNFEDVDPDEQPLSLLMHSTLRIPDMSEGSDGTAEIVSRPVSEADLGAPLSNPLLKPVLKASVRMAPGSRPADMGASVIASAQSNAQSSWDDWQDSLPLLSALAVQPLRPSIRYQSGGCSRVISQRVLEFPCVNPEREGLPARYVFGAAALHPHKNRPQQAIAMYDIHTGTCEYWSRGWRYYVGEPEMIPSLPGCHRPDIEKELDGWVLSICYDAERHVSEIVVLDAANIRAGPVAWAELPVVVPHGLHGTWVPSL